MKPAFALLIALILACWTIAPELLAIEYKAKGLRDPFSDLTPPPVAEKPEENEELVSALELHGIVFGGSEPRAIVNGQIVKVGSKLRIGTVESISKEGVTVRYNGRDFLLKRKEKKDKT